MERRFSEMSEHEIRQEIANLNEKAKKAEQMVWSVSLQCMKERRLWQRLFIKPTGLQA